MLEALMALPEIRHPLSALPCFAEVPLQMGRRNSQEWWRRRVETYYKLQYATNYNTAGHRYAMNIRMVRR